MKKFLYNHLNTIAAVAFTVVFMAVVWHFCPIRFETNDDSYILAIVSGAFTGVPCPSFYHINIIWGFFLAGLYKLNETIPWYAISFICLVLVSLSVICAYCINIFKNKDNLSINFENKKYHDVLYIGAGIGVFCILYFMLLCYYTVLFQYTVISAMCGLGAILLIPAYKISSGRQKCFAYFLMVFLMICAQTIWDGMDKAIKYNYLLYCNMVYRRSRR